MGNRQSNMSANNNSVYKILEINENSTPSEIRQSYIRLLRKHHPDYGKEKDPEKTQLIIAAYTKLKEKDFKPLISDLFVQINFQRYNLLYFQQLENLAFITEVNRIYNLIVKNENIYLSNGNYPKFGDANTNLDSINKFYQFFRSFKTNARFERNINNRNVYDKQYDKEERRAYNETIRKLTCNVYLCDFRVKRNVFENVVTVVTEKVEKIKFKKKKDVEKYAFYCDACKKGFMSDKRMISHVRGEKHKNKMSDLGLEDKGIEEILSEAQKRTKAVVKEDFVTDREIHIENDRDSEPEIETEQSLSETKTKEQSDAVNQDNINTTSYDSVYANNISSKATKENEELSEARCDQKSKVENVQAITNKIVNLKIKKCKGKTTKKKPVNHKDKETLQMLTCAICKKTYESRNKLFLHIKAEHLSQNGSK